MHAHKISRLSTLDITNNEWQTITDNLRTEHADEVILFIESIPSELLDFFDKTD